MNSNSVVFTGKTKDYFQLWIVNLFLSLVTLGVYSAWATVRNNKYLYGHTQVDGHSLHYHATPKQILKGRIIAVLLFGSFLLASYLSIPAAIGLAVVVMLLTPWILVQSLRFNHRMISYRNVRFDFVGGVGRASVLFVLYPILSMFTLYLAYPLIIQKQDEYLMENKRYGGQRAITLIRASVYYKACLVAALIMIPVVGFAFAVQFNAAQTVSRDSFSLVETLLPLLYLVFGPIAASAYLAIVRNHKFNETSFTNIARFQSDVTMLSFIWLNIVNTLAFVFSLGLATPWIRIRRTRYLAEHTQFFALSGLDEVIGEQNMDATAWGDEAADLFDMGSVLT